MSNSRGGRSGIVAAVVVFCLGTGLGFAWRQGWLPVELLPAQTGVLDQLADEAEEDSPPVMGTDPPVADTSPAHFVDPAAIPDFDAAILHGPSEPGMSAADPARQQPYRRSPSLLPSDTASEARSAKATPSLPLDQADVTNFASATGTTSPPGSVQMASAAQFAPAPRGAIADSSENPTSVDLEAVLAEFDGKLHKGEILAAHRLLSQVYWKQRALRRQLMERLDQTANAIFFQSQPHFVEPYVIQPGDRLETIAAEYKIPWEYLSKLNRVDPKRIQADRRLKVIRGPFSAVVELTDFSLTVHLQGYYVRRIPVGIGRDGASPIGKFPVLNKVENPQYTDPDGRVIDADDPANPLGERWIDLGGSYGIHGTIEPESIGTAASRGCIRLGNDDIVLVYDLLTVGSEVVIRR